MTLARRWSGADKERKKILFSLSCVETHTRRKKYFKRTVEISRENTMTCKKKNKF